MVYYGFVRVKDLLLPVYTLTFPNPYVRVSFKSWWDFHVTCLMLSLTILGKLSVISSIALCWGQIGKSYLARGRAKSRKSSKVEFIWTNSEFGGV